MLLALIRMTSVGISIFLAMLAFLFVITEEESFPGGADATMSIAFDDVDVTREEVVSQLGVFSALDDVRLLKVVADPDDFYNGRSLFEFGPAAPSSPREVEWATPGRYGFLVSAEELDVASLDGVYAVIGSPQLENTTEWLDAIGASYAVQQKTWIAVMQFALFNTGAWLPLATCGILGLVIAVTWFALRSRARTLAILNGLGTGSIILNETASLMRTLALPIALGSLSATGVFAIASGTIHVPSFLSVLMILLGLALASIIVVSVIATIVTWPSVEAIASRVPPERHYGMLSGVLKVVVVILVAATMPAAVNSVDRALQVGSQGSYWAELRDEVAVRVATSNAELEQRLGDLAALARSADQERALSLSYAFQEDVQGSDGRWIDGVILVNPRYLDTFGALIEPWPLEELPPELVRNLADSHEIWTTGGAFSEDFAFRRLAPAAEGVPALLPQSGSMQVFRSPLIVVIEEPGRTFNDSFLASTMTSANTTFSRDWLLGNLPNSAADDMVLSVDRIADAGLAESQNLLRTAATQSFALALSVIGLATIVVVSAWIYSLVNARKIFVKRTSGLPWLAVFRRRLTSEIVIAGMLSAVVLATASEWFSAAIVGSGIYIAGSFLLHFFAMRRSFGYSVNRKS